MDVLEEGDEADQVLVVGSALPGIEDNRVLRLLSNVALVGVEDDDLGQVSVQVRQIL